MGRFEDKHYEAVVVFHPALTAQQLADEIEKFKTLIKNNDGQDIEVVNMGRRELAYNVSKQRMGTYIEFHFHSFSPVLIAEFTRILRITESVLLFQTHRIQLAKRKYKGNPKFVSADGYTDDDDSDSMDSRF
jgi:small subunit ribosomal protein S6